MESHGDELASSFRTQSIFELGRLSPSHLQKAWMGCRDWKGLILTWRRNCLGKRQGRRRKDLFLLLADVLRITRTCSARTCNPIVDFPLLPTIVIPLSTSHYCRPSILPPRHPIVDFPSLSINIPLLTSHRCPSIDCLPPRRSHGRLPIVVDFPWQPLSTSIELY